MYADFNSWSNNSIISEPSNIVIQTPNNKTSFDSYGYVKVIAIGCYGCTALKKMPCLPDLYPSTTSTQHPSTTTAMPSTVVNAFDQSYCPTPSNNTAGMVMMGTSDIAPYWPANNIQNHVKSRSTNTVALYLNAHKGR